MGSPKDYIALPTSDVKTTDSPPPPYEGNNSPWYRRHWKAAALLFTFATLLIVGFSIHPSCHGQKPPRIVDLGFPHDSQHENLAAKDLSFMMSKLVDRTKHHDKKHHHHNHNHRKHHDKHDPAHHEHHRHHQSDHDMPPHQLAQPEHDQPPHHHPDHGKHPHHEPHHHHHQHPKNPEHREHREHHKHHKHHHHHHHNEKRQNEDDEEVYVQKLPTHNRYQPPHGLQRRDEHQQWKQSYILSPSANVSLHIKTFMLHESFQGSVTLRQDTTGVQQDITVTCSMNNDEGDAPIRFSATIGPGNFFLSAHPSSKKPPTSLHAYSIDIVLSSSIKALDRLNIEINNGTITIDESLRSTTFQSVSLAASHGAISVDNLVANRITVGTYSGVITGTFEPTERLAVGAYRGMSNVRLLQSSSLSPLHIASSSPHGTSTLSLERGVFEGRFVAKGHHEQVPNVNFTSNDQESYGYEVVDDRVSGWLSSDDKPDRLVIHGRKETNLIFD